MADPNLGIRELNERDLEAVLRIEVASFSLPLSKLALVFLSETCLFYVATIKDEVAGYIVLGYGDANILHCFRIAVDPMHKRRGIASRLLKKGIEENPCQCYTTEIRKSNFEGMRFWKSQGFREIPEDRRESLILVKEGQNTARESRGIHNDFVDPGYTPRVR